MSVRICEVCGNKIEEGKERCSYCGALYIDTEENIDVEKVDDIFEELDAVTGKNTKKTANGSEYDASKSFSKEPQESEEHETYEDVQGGNTRRKILRRFLLAVFAAALVI